MNTTPSNPQLKIPTFNTSTFRFAQLNPVRQNTVSTTNIGGAAAASNNKAQTIRLTTPPTFKNSATNVTTTKISVDGRVIDIDVLTKLHQNNSGNIVSFTASKELLSNLANNKLPSVTAKVNTHQIITSKPPPQTIAVTVFGSQGTKQFTQGSMASSATPVKVYSEKFLLPKTSTQTVQYPMTKPPVEVKKFAPEMNGLLSGLSTALRTSSANAPNQDMKNIKTFTWKNQNSVTPVAISFITDPKSQKGTATMILPAASATNKPLTPSSTPNNLKQNGMKVKSIIQSNSVQPKLFGKSIIYNARNIIQRTTKATLQQPVGNTTTTSNFNKQTSARTSAPTPAIVENKTYRMNKNVLENNKKNTFKIHTLVLHDVLRKEAAMKKETAKTEDDKAEIDGFDKLYEDAVNNVLKIKAFPDDFESKKNKQTIREIKEEFKQYLETPMDIEKRINQGVYKYSRKRKSPSDDVKSLPTEKKLKLIDSDQLERYLKSDTPSTTTATTIKPFSTIPCNSVSPKPVTAHPPEKSKDVPNFFSQILTDKTKIPKPFGTQAYFSPMDYPWFYPTYFFDPNFYANRPPPLLANPPLPANVQASVKTDVIEEKEEVLEQSPLDEKKTRTRSVTNSLNKTKKGIKQNLNIENKNIKATKVQKQSTQYLKTTAKVTKKENEKKTIVSNKKLASTKKEQNTYRLNNEKKENALLTNSEKVAKLSVSAEKRLRNKDNLKFRYSLRQRAKALKKAKKLAKLRGEESPKLILKKLDKKTSTKKELFLANFGLRRILKRIDTTKAIVKNEKCN